MAKLFDTQCWDLACHFLADVPGATDDDRTELASEFQDCADEVLSDLNCCRVCGACPGFIGAECDGTCDWEKADAGEPA